MDAKGSSNTVAGGRWRRIAAATLVMAGMSGPLLGFSPAGAQESGTLSTAAITPADAAVYAEILLDPEGEQLQQLDDLLLRLGSEDSIIESLGDVNTSGSSTVDLTGAEAALVLLPAALESQDAGSVVSDGLSGDTDAILENVGMATDTTEGVVLLLKPTDLDAAVDAVEAELVDKAGTAGDVESETVDGVEIRSVPARDTDDGQAYAVVNDIVVFGTVPSDVSPFIGASSGGSLAESESFQTASDLLPDERAVFAFLNGGAFIDALAASEDEDVQMVTDLAEELGNLNLDQGLAVVAEENGLRVETVQVPRDGATPDAEAGGLASDLTVADRVPADTVLYVNGFNLGQTALLEGVALLVVSALAGASGDDTLPVDATPAAEPVASPVGDDVDALYEAAAETIGVNLKTDFLDTLNGEYAFALWGVDVEDPANIGAILTSDVSDVAALDGTLSFISLFVTAGAGGQASVATRTVGDAEVKNVVLGDPAAPISIDYGIVDEELLIGVGDGVDTYVNGPDASLASDATYQETLGLLPTEYDGVFYTDLAALTELSTELEGATAGLSTQDASEECAAYADQAEAQDAYDADQSTNFELDQDFDGEACEDYFVSTDATPIAEAVADVPVDALAMVSYKQDGYAFTSSILTLTDES